VRVRPAGAFDETVLSRLAEVSDVSRSGGQYVVTGSGDLVNTVAATLAAHRIPVSDLRSEPATLDDAFIALTGHHPIES
jgi:ABC-2 type transport system ATP-binding protein